MIKKKNGKNSNMTLDKLATMVAKGFENTATKDDLKYLEGRMNKKIEGVKIDVEGLKNKIEGINNKIDDLAENRVKYKEFEALKRRVEVLEKV